MKWELKDLSYYLAYGIEFTSMVKLGDTVQKFKLSAHHLIGSDWFKNKLILRPYSDLIKEIEIKGEKFIPIVELAKLSGDKIKAVVDLTYRKFETENHEQYKIEYIDDSKNMTEFNFNPHLDRFWKAINHDYIAFVNQKQLFEKLHEWGFDTGNYISSGLAVDSNSL